MHAIRVEMALKGFVFSPVSTTGSFVPVSAEMRAWSPATTIPKDGNLFGVFENACPRDG